MSQSRRRLHRATLALAIGCISSLAGVGAGGQAAAGSPQDVVIDVHSELDLPGTFTATGGGLCPSGTTTDSPVRVAGGSREQPRQLTFHLLKTFECDDGSGTFTLQIQAQVHLCEPADAGAWTAKSGTGHYAGIHGAGVLVGTYFPGDVCDAIGIDDHLVGRMSIG